MKYGIKVYDNRFLEWVDSHWYGTKKDPIYPFFSKEEAESAIYQLINHYQRNVSLVCEDGTEINYESGKPVSLSKTHTEFAPVYEGLKEQDDTDDISLF